MSLNNYIKRLFIKLIAPLHQRLQTSPNQVCALLLSEPWILDADATIKTLYGHQEGAEVGYNPHKPGRPSHTFHTYMIANLRLILNVEVQGGKQVASKNSSPGLMIAALLQTDPILFCHSSSLFNCPIFTYNRCGSLCSLVGFGLRLSLNRLPALSINKTRRSKKLI